VRTALDLSRPSDRPARAVAKAFGFVAYTLAVSGLVAAAVASAGAVGPGGLAASFAVSLSCLVALGLGCETFRPSTLKALLTAFAAGEGVFWAFVAQQADAGALAGAVLVAAAVYGACAAWGWRTRRDLSGWGPFLLSALIGLLLAALVTVAFGGGVALMLVSAAGVPLFMAYTAYDVATVRREAALCDSEEEVTRLALRAGVGLYLDLANLVVDALRLGRSAGEGVLEAVGESLGLIARALAGGLKLVGEAMGS